MPRTTLRLLPLLAAALLLAACAGSVDNMKLATEAKLRQTLTSHFTRQFGRGITTVVQGLAVEGGFLDNPLVRILLPPPMGLVIDVARDFHHNPRAALLETLMNRAAENAVPGAAPILQAVLATLDSGDRQSLFEAGKTAATDHLRAVAGEAVHQALLPVIAENLVESGAVKLHGELLRAHQAAGLLGGDLSGDEPWVAEGELDEYVTARTVDGLFRLIGNREALVRDGIASLQQGTF